MIGIIIKKIRTSFYTNMCKKTAKHYGNGLHINHGANLHLKRILAIIAILMV